MAWVRSPVASAVDQVAETRVEPGWRRRDWLCCPMLSAREPRASAALPTSWRTSWHSAYSRRKHFLRCLLSRQNPHAASELYLRSGPSLGPIDRGLLRSGLLHSLHSPWGFLRQRAWSAPGKSSAHWSEAEAHWDHPEAGRELKAAAAPEYQRLASVVFLPQRLASFLPAG